MPQDSIYYHKPGGLREYIKRILDKSITIPQAFSTYREIRVLPSRFRDMTVQTLSDSPNLMQEFSEALTSGMQPESKYRLPYKKAEREKELIESVAEVYDIDKCKVQSKVVTGHYKDPDSAQEFNYAIEVAVAPRKDLNVEKHAGEVEFIGNINSTPSIDGGEGYFTGGLFRFKDRNGEIREAQSIRGVLHKCGFTASDYYNRSRKKVPSVVVINLKTPCPDWLGSAGKTRVDLKPYADVIAQTLYNLTKKIPSYHGRRKRIEDDYRPERQKEQEEYMIEFLEERYKAVQADPSVKIIDRITQRGACYRVRPRMIQDGFGPRINWGVTMKSLAGSINRLCKEYLHVDREALGIIASPRALMLYKGMSYPVTIDNLKALALNGVAIIIIEKEGIAEVLADRAKKYGIALVHTKGRFTEYGKDLIEAAKRAGSVVGILVDYDVVGEGIAKSSRTQTPRIGITRDTITWLQRNGYPDLSVADVEEEYTPSEYTKDPYLKNKRIELDSIVAKIGAEGLWRFVLHRLKELGPFNYTREVSMPSYETLYTREMVDMKSYLGDYMAGTLREAKEITDNELTEVDGLIDIEAKEKEIRTKWNEIVSKNLGIKTISSEFRKLLERLPKIPRKEEDDNGEG
jgi:hypothetical protein